MKKALLLFLILTLFKGISQNDKEYMKTSLVKLNKTAPDFSFTTKENTTLHLSDYRGKVILLNFFATWCGPCMQEMPYLQKELWDKLKDNPSFMLLSFGRDHTQDEVNKFIDSKKFTFPIYSDVGKLIYDKYATKFIPRNYLIDQNGKVIYASTGFSVEEFEKLKLKIDELLKQ